MTWSRRRFLATAASASAGLAAGWPRIARAQARSITVAHSVSTFVYGQHLVAKEKRFFEDEGVSVPGFIVPGGGARVINALTAGQAMFGLGDSNHPLKATEKGRDTAILFATDRRCSYANIVVRKELYDRGVKSVEALGDGKPVNDHVEWVGGGASTTMLGGLKAGKFDAIMAVPEWQFAAETEGFGHPIYDVLDEKAWNRVFGGPIPVTVGYVLRETIEKSPDLVQAYVNACYRAQQWIHKAKDEEIVELLYKPYMDAFTREDVLKTIRYYKTIFDWDLLIAEKDYANGLKVFIPTAIDKPIPFAKAVDQSFVKKAQATYKS